MVNSDDDIDSEALQAQIDLSMSFINEMVTSWVKPGQSVSKRSHNDLEHELEEYMRRPPRLGVGAPIPEGPSFSREAARLKGQLSQGKKRTREEDNGSRVESLDDPEESRAVAIRKKAKVDVFASGNGKKKKRKGEVTNGLLAPAATPQRDKPSAESDRPDIEVDGTSKDSHQESTLSSVGPVLQKGQDPASCDVNKTTSSCLLPASPVSRADMKPTDTLRSQSAKQKSAIHPPTIPEVIDRSRTATPIRSELSTPIRQEPLLIEKRPLLGLDEPPGTETLGTSGKKKRKRRKKRKSSTVDSDVQRGPVSNPPVIHNFHVLFQ